MHGTKCNVLCNGVCAVAGGLGGPELLDRRATADLDEKVGEEIGVDVKKDGVADEAEGAVDAEELQVEEDEGGLVAGEGKDVKLGGAGGGEGRPLDFRMVVNRGFARLTLGSKSTCATRGPW